MWAARAVLLARLGCAAHAQTTAVSTDDFLNSIGVCVHIAQGVDDATEVAACLRHSGIRGIRDDGSINPATIQGWIKLHQSSGAKVCLLPINGNIPQSLFVYEQLAAAGALLAAEGPNEPNNAPVTYEGVKSCNTNSLPVARFQRDLYQAVKADPMLAGIPVFASSEAGGSQPNNCGLQFLTIPSGAGTLMPDGAVYADYANTHNYVCDHLSSVIDNNAWGAEDPALKDRWDGMQDEYGRTWWSPGYNGYTSNQLLSLPRVTTETGWTTQGSNSLSEVQQGKLFLNLYLAAFKRGWRYTFIYMLHDDPVQGYWGLYHTDYTAKPSGTYLHNLATILADKAPATPGSLNYVVPNEPATVHDLLLQKSDRTFELAVWGEQVSGSNNITVSLGAKYATVNVYDPTIGTSATQTLHDAASVPLILSDHPLIVEMSTNSAAPQ
jgi:hypothetical protein